MEQQERKVGILMLIAMVIGGTQNESSVSTDAFGIIDVVVWFEPKRREKRYKLFLETGKVQSGWAKEEQRKKE